MRKVFRVRSYQNLDWLVLVARLAIGSLMLVHGLPKLAMLIEGGPVAFPNVLGMGASVSLALAVFAEVLCSVLILAGLGTRIATVPLMITMLIAVFYIHGNDPFIQQEMGLHYLLVYGLLLVAGSGKYSADYLIDKFYDRKAVVARSQA